MSPRRRTRAPFDQTQEVTEDGPETVEIRRHGGLLVPYEELEGRIGEPGRPSPVHTEFESSIEHHPMSQSVNLGLDDSDVGIHSTPGTYRTFRRVVQPQCHLDEPFDPLAWIGLGTDHLELGQRAVDFPVFDELTSVLRPVVEVVIERSRGDPQSVAYLGQLQPEMPSVAENFEPDCHVILPCHGRTDRWASSTGGIHQILIHDK